MADMGQTKKLIDTLTAVAFGNRDLESTRVILHNLCIEADKEVELLKTKAAELDRREKGVPVVLQKYSDGQTYEFCGSCEVAVCGGENYCPTCGTKLIWDSEV